MPRTDKPRYNNGNKHEHKQDHRQHDPESDEITEEEEKWNPTTEAFEAFSKQDEALATSNVRMVLGARKFPMNLKEVKGSTLHSIEMVERVLLQGVSDGSIQEVKGEYSLTAK